MRFHYFKNQATSRITEVFFNKQIKLITYLSYFINTFTSKLQNKMGLYIKIYSTTKINIVIINRHNVWLLQILCRLAYPNILVSHKKYNSSYCVFKYV